MTRVQKYEPLYNAFQRFLRQCLLNNRSLLWPTEQAWTRENVQGISQNLNGPQPKLFEPFPIQCRGRIAAQIGRVRNLPPHRREHNEHSK